MDTRKRRNIPSKERAAIFKAWRNTCAYCETNPAEMVDHIIPFSKGGQCVLENFAASCKRCNLKKTNHSFGEGYLQIILAIAKNKAEKIQVELEKETKNKKSDKPNKPKKSKEKRPENYILASGYEDWLDVHTEIVEFLAKNNKTTYCFNTKNKKDIESLYVFSILVVEGNKGKNLLESITSYKDTDKIELRIAEGALDFLKICAERKPKKNEIIEL